LVLIVDLSTPEGLAVLLSGAIMGLLFGFGLQRGRFCMNSAFRDILLMKDTTLIKAVLLAVLIQLVGLQILVEAGQIDFRNAVPLFPVAAMIGGFTFGIGMVIAGGCASGISYRTGEGMVGSFIALLGFGIGANIFGAGAGGWISRELRTVRIPEIDARTLPDLIGINPWYIIGTFIILAILLCVFFRPELPKLGNILKGGWPWWFTGIFLGIVGIFAFWVSVCTAARYYGFAITFPWANQILGTLMFGEGGNTITWDGFAWIALVVGSFIGAYLSGEFKFRIPSPERTLQGFGGGLIMGAGAKIGMGCNIGHIFSGWPQLALGSLLGGFFIIIGCWFATYILFMR
jgi:hypothetical protein